MSHAEIKFLKVSNFVSNDEQWKVLQYNQALLLFMYILISFVAKEGEGVRRLANRVTKDHIHR